MRFYVVHAPRFSLEAIKQIVKVCGKSIKERRGSNIAAVALANKNVRMIWALLSSVAVYEKNVA